MEKLAIHAAVALKQGIAVLVKATEENNTLVYKELDNPDNPENKVQYKRWEKLYNSYLWEEKDWTDNKAKAFNLVLLHCLPNIEPI